MAIAGEEGGIFEKREQREIRHHREDHTGFALSLGGARCGHDLAAEIIDRRGNEHQDGEPGIPPAVEDVAHQGEHEVLPGAGKRVVQQQRQRQKIENEDMGAENHSEGSGKKGAGTVPARRPVRKEIAGSIRNGG